MADGGDIKSLLSALGAVLASAIIPPPYGPIVGGIGLGLVGEIIEEKVSDFALSSRDNWLSRLRPQRNADLERAMIRALHDTLKDVEEQRKNQTQKRKLPEAERELFKQWRSTLDGFLSLGDEPLLRATTYMPPDAPTLATYTESALSDSLLTQLKRLAEPTVIPESLEQFLRERLAERFLMHYRELLKKSEYSRAWIAFQRQMLEAILQAIGNIPDNIRTYIEEQFIQLQQKILDKIISSDKFEQFIESVRKDYAQQMQLLQEIYVTNREDHAQQLQLLEQILARLNEVQPARVVPERYANIPRQTACFVPKQEEIDALRERIPHHRCVALSGLGGIGKTQSAIAVANSLTDQYDYILWLSAEDIRFAGTGLRMLVDALNLPGVNPEHGETYLQALLIWLRSESSKNWLLVIDNADEPESLQEFFKELRAPHGKVLLTTRASAGRLATLNILPDAVVEAKTMTEAQALDFLFARTGKPRTPETEQTAKAIAQRLGYLPLALEQASAYITQTQSPLKDYLQLYDQKRREWDQRYRPQMGNYPATVGTTWLINIERVQQASPASVELLRLLAFFDSERIPLWLVLEVVRRLEPSQNALQPIAHGESALREALAPLIGYSLVVYDSYIEQEGERVPYSCAVHRLVQEVVRDSLDEAQAQWIAQLLQAYSEIAPDPQSPAEWERWRELLPHLQVALSKVAPPEVEFRVYASLLIRAGLFLYYQGRYSEAKFPLSQALETLREPTNSDSIMEANCLNILAGVYIFQGDIKSAEELLSNALKIVSEDQALPKEDHERLKAVILSNLGLTYRILCRYKDAEQKLREASVIFQKQSDIQIVGCLNTLAGVCRVQGNYKEAESLLNQLLETLESLEYQDDVAKATCYHHRGLVYRMQGRYEEAEQQYERARETKIRCLGDEHYDTAITLNNLGVLYGLQGRYREAKSVILDALRILNNQLGEINPYVGICHNNLANIYSELKNYKDSENHYSIALDILKQTIGDEHPDTAGCYSNIALLYRLRRKYDEAERYFKKSIEIRQKILGEENPRIAICYNNLAELYYTRGKYENAEELFEKALNTFKTVLGLEHPSTLIVATNYYTCLLAMGRYNEAYRLSLQIPEVRGN